VFVCLQIQNPTGKRPKESPTHYDPVDNLFLQIKGTKSFGLYQANYFSAIYPKFMRVKSCSNPDSGNNEVVRNSIQDNFSPVDPHDPDHRAFPLAKRAIPTICKLNAGDALYMPAFTWHSVQSFGDKDDKLNYGLNMWFEGDQRYQVLFEAMMTILQGSGLGELELVKNDAILAESESGRPVEG